jgi:hypothetical protein
MMKKQKKQLDLAITSTLPLLIVSTAAGMALLPPAACGKGTTKTKVEAKAVSATDIDTVTDARVQSAIATLESTAQRVVYDK